MIAKPAEAPRPAGSTQTSLFQRAAAAPAAQDTASIQRAAPAPVVPRAVVRLPIDPILSRMPTTLTALQRRNDVREIAIPLQVITSQLGTGAVRVTFGEFRKFAPEGTFAENPVHDQVCLELPLRDVLARVSPQLMARKSQKKIEVPDSVTSVFGPSGTSGQPSALGQATSVPLATAPVTTAPVAMPASAPVRMPAAPNGGVAPEVAVLTVAISAVNAGWPDHIRADIERYGLQQGALLLPISRLEPAIKSGRVSFSWTELAGWLKPGLPAGVPLDPGAWVDLPLPVVAPLFMARFGAPSKPRKKAGIYEEMPDLFSGKADAPSSTPASNHSMPASLADLLPKPVPMAPKPAPATDDKTESVTEILTRLYKPDWSPLDLVTKTAALPGNAGALLATKDGLPVAHKLPSHLNAETVSAFLPQMFSRMNHYSTELQLGPLSSLTLTMGTVPCIILEAGTLYFIVLGRAGEPLPAAQIKQIAAELAKRNS